jgi:nucleoside phosphorylase
MIIRFRPKLVAMVGIAAGAKSESQGFGDILTPDHTFDYGFGKSKLEEDRGKKTVTFHPDPKPLDVDGRLLQRLSHWKANKADVLDEIRRAWPGDKASTVLQMHIGTLASGAAVIDSKPPVDQIRRSWRKLVGLEMEAYAVHRACKDTIEPPPKFLCLKAVCDFAENKEDVWQRYAAFTAAELCHRFLVAEWDILFPER